MHSSAGTIMATKAIDAPRKASAGTKTNQRRIRKIFGNIHEISQMPNLIEVQRESYEQFLRSDPAIGYVSGLEKTLRSVFPIVDFAGTSAQRPGEGIWSFPVASRGRIIPEVMSACSCSTALRRKCSPFAPCRN